MKIVLLQTTIYWGDVTANLESIGKKLGENLSCDMILLPEMFASGSIMGRQEKELVYREICKYAERYEEIRSRLSEWAKFQKAVIAGSAVCREKESFFNRMILAFPDGSFKYYDKRHCFSMAGEDEYFTAGKEKVIFEYKGVKIAVFICYDLRFPVWSRNINNYDLAVYIANWPEARIKVWETLLCARAIENQCFVAGVNCVGEDNYGLKYVGGSMLLNAKGELIAKGEDKEILISGELNVSDLSDFRSRFPVLKDGDQFEIL